MAEPTEIESGKKSPLVINKSIEIGIYNLNWIRDKIHDYLSKLLCTASKNSGQRFDSRIVWGQFLPLKSLCCFT